MVKNSRAPGEKYDALTTNELFELVEAGQILGRIETGEQMVSTQAGSASLMIPTTNQAHETIATTFNLVGTTFAIGTANRNEIADRPAADQKEDHRGHKEGRQQRGCL